MTTTLDPQVLSILTRARAHILTRTLAGHSAEAVRHALLAPAVLKAVEYVNDMADTGDLRATEAACQRWNAALRQALKEKRWTP